MEGLFSGCTALDSIDLSGFNTEAVTNMANIFSGCTGMTGIDLSPMNTSTVTSMAGMFNGCSALTRLDLTGFNTAHVKSMNEMFKDCTGLTTIIAGDDWNTDSVTVSDEMFSNCTSLVGSRGTAYDADHVDVSYAHIDGGPNNPGYMSPLAEVYVMSSPDSTTLTFCYDGLRGSREGSTYHTGDLSSGNWTRSIMSLRPRKQTHAATADMSSWATIAPIVRRSAALAPSRGEA